ncbi:MAG: hypothetical protein ACI4IF_00840 [Acutalibacteraceae bacterium]
MADQNFLTYKGKPLVRKDKTIYYGSMSDPFLIMLSVVESHDVKDIKVSDKVIVQLINTSIANPLEAIVKKTEKNGLYAALDIASVWLERALKSE